MEIEQSALMPEIQAVINSGPNPVHFLYQATIHVNARNLDFPTLKVVSLDNIEDFEKSYTAQKMLEVSVMGGQFANQVYPYRDNLDISISQFPLMATGDQPNSTQPTQVTRYQATLVDRGDPLIQGTGRGSPSQETMDLTNILQVEFQLIDKSLEQMRMASFGGIFRQATVASALKTVMTSVSQNVQTDQNLKVKGVDMVAPSNTAMRNHIVIPHGTRLMDIPRFIHEKCGGVYSAGMGAYLKNGIWSIYPSYDNTSSRFAAAKNTATIIVVPPNRFNNLEITYRQAGSNLTLIATGDIKFLGDSTTQQLNHGNGVRYLAAGNVMNGFTQNQNNQALASRGANNSEYLSVKRPTGYQNVQMNKEAITDNPYTAASSLARRNGSVISLVWENSNDTLITPNMMVQVLYLESDTVQTLTGVMLKSHTYTEMSGPGMTNGRHISRTALSCFVQNPTTG